MALNKDCFNKVVNLLTPHMQDEGMRQAILQPALYDTSLLNQIVFSGNANTFTVMLVRRLDTFGRVTKDKTAVTAVLEALQGHVGWDQQEEIKQLIGCAEAGITVVKPHEIKIPDLPQPTNTEVHEHIFISYSSADRVSFVDRLAMDLSNAGHMLWVDNLDEKYGGIIGGRLWQQELSNALNHSKLVIFTITPDSIRSKWCKAELKRAGENGIPVIGIIARPLTTSDDQINLANIQFGGRRLTDTQIRNFHEMGYQQGLTKLINDIKQNLKI